jgi:hypothetical protein
VGDFSTHFTRAFPSIVTYVLEKIWTIIRCTARGSRSRGMMGVIVRCGDEQGSQSVGNLSPKTNPMHSPSQQQVLGGVKHHRVSCRTPQKTKLCKGVRPDPKGSGPASLRVRTRAAAPGIARPLRKDTERVLSRTLARTSLLRSFGRTGPRKVSLILLRAQTRAAKSGDAKERN